MIVIYRRRKHITRARAASAEGVGSGPASAPATNVSSQFQEGY